MSCGTEYGGNNLASWLIEMDIPVWSGVFAGHWSTWSCKSGTTYRLCSSVGFNHTTNTKPHVNHLLHWELLQEAKSTSLILHLSAVMNQMFPGTIWSYLGSPERITWSFTTLVKQNTFFVLTPTGQAIVHCQIDSFLYYHHTRECLMYIRILNSVHPCLKPLNPDLWNFMKEECMDKIL